MVGDVPLVGERTRLLSQQPRIYAPADSSNISSTSSILSPSKEPPELLVWLIPALICALCYALYNIFIKKGSATIHPILGGVILQIVAAILGTALCGFLTYGPAKEEMFYDSTGVNWAILAGFAV